MAGRSVTLSLAAWFAVLVLAGCTDSKEVNAAFNRTRVTWYLFDRTQPDGLRVLPGFDQPQNVPWEVRPKAVLATDLEPSAGNQAAVAVSHLGLLVLDDAAGMLMVIRPGAAFPLESYQTDLLFSWQDKTFVTLRRDPASPPPASLAWWVPGQSRLALYPIPSQVRDAGRQAVAFEPPAPGTSLVTVTWKVPDGQGWKFERSEFNLADGSEMMAGPGESMVMTMADPALAAVKARLAERLGAGVPTREGKAGPPLVFTGSGWVSVGRAGEGSARLYRLPDLGAAGLYTHAVGLSKVFVFTLETLFRGYAGAAGLVYVPFGVLSP